MLFQSCQTATKSFLLQNSLMGVGMGVGPYGKGAKRGPHWNRRGEAASCPGAL